MISSAEQSCLSTDILQNGDSMKLLNGQRVPEAYSIDELKAMLESADIQSFALGCKALEFAKTLDLILVPYENAEGMTATTNALAQLKTAKSVGIFIGPEGGFEKTEIEKAIESGAKIISLGKRILRTETAAITATAMCMLNIEASE